MKESKETMSCRTCRYWEEEHDHYAHFPCGQCTKTMQLWDAVNFNYQGELVTLDKAKDTSMFVQDGSDYFAVLYTRPEHYCAEFSLKDD